MVSFIKKALVTEKKKKSVYISNKYFADQQLVTGRQKKRIERTETRWNFECIVADNLEIKLYSKNLWLVNQQRKYSGLIKNNILKNKIKGKRKKKQMGKFYFILF